MDPLLLLLIIILPLLAFQFFYNGRKRKQQQEKRKEQLVPGAKVMTSSGFFGTVVTVRDEENKVAVEFAPGVEITVHTQAITTITDPNDEGAADSKEEDSLADNNPSEPGEIKEDVKEETKADEANEPDVQESSRNKE